MRRWLVALAALVCGGGVSAGLLWFQRPDAGASAYYVLARDLPAGAAVTADALRVERLRLGAVASSALPVHSDRELGTLRATHDLAAGQLLQRADVAAPEAGRRRVLVPLQAVPPVAAGEGVDFLLLTGAGDRTVVSPFALGLRVQSVLSSGVVVSASPDQAAALVYAASTQRLVAVAAGGPGPAEPNLSSLDEAQAAARR